MVYSFGDCRLDVGARELRRAGVVVPVEPQVFDLLRLLIETRTRVVSRDEIIERIWGGRIVSDSAVASRIKSARQAIGDDGSSQRLIRTHHGVGFRFVGDVAAMDPSDALVATQDEKPETAPTGRPSIAVLPFQLVGVAGPYTTIAEALPHDLIVELSRLRWLMVIARGSSFQFRTADATQGRLKAALGVRYVLTGVVEIAGPRLTVTVELSDTDEAAVVWCDVYRDEVGAVHEIRSKIAQAVVAALELQIPLAEARRAVGAPSHLDAWAAYHLGLAQMFRFDREGAERARGFFERAVELEPGFARAHAGLSFAHFEDAFLRFASDRGTAAVKARRCADAALALDPLDPFCNLVMGRSAWLTGDLEGALPWLDRAVELNPNYAQGKYSSAWTLTQLGEGAHSQALVDSAMALSPLDPLLYGMLGVRAFSHIVRDEPAEAAHWGERSARAPYAHPLIEMIAAVGHGLNGDEARARAWLQSAARRQRGLSSDRFFEAFPCRDPAVHARIEAVLNRLTN
jgi:DNA-binding winged helix-turn-helix (wHTH) protein